MNEQATNEAERSIRQAFDTGRMEDAASAALAAYGDQIFSFIASRLRSHSDAQEAFSAFAEDLWTGLPQFSWRSSMRTWSYTIARNAAARFAASNQRRHARNVPLTGPLADLVAAMRTSTNIYQKTAVKDRFRSLREQLSEEDQTLLVLRVDRGMAWRDLAMTMLGDIDLDDDALTRESVRLRKAFERLKGELRRRAKQEGLLEGDER